MRESEYLCVREDSTLLVLFRDNWIRSPDVTTTTTSEFAGVTVRTSSDAIGCARLPVPLRGGFA